MSIWDFWNRWFPQSERSLENPNLPLNDPAQWAEIFGDYFGSISGESISAQRAMEYPPFAQAVTTIAHDVARLPLRLYERTSSLGQESRREAIDDIRSHMVGVQPNEFFSASQFWARVMQAALVYGRAAVEVIRRNDRSASRLLLLNPRITEVETDDDGEIFFHLKTTTPRRISPDNVIHIEWFGFDEIDVLAPYNVGRNAIGLGLAQERFASLFFRAGGRSGGILELPAGMPKVARDNIEEGFRTHYEASNAFRTVILRDNAKFHSAQTSPEDSQLVEASAESARQIARLFNLPPSKLGLSDSTSYNSKAEDNRAYLDNSLARWLSQIQQQCNLKLLTETEQDTMFFEFDTSELLRLDKRAQADVHSIQIQNRIKNPNECRLDLNMPPYEGGDVFENPATSSGATSDGADIAFSGDD